MHLLDLFIQSSLICIQDVFFLIQDIYHFMLLVYYLSNMNPFNLLNSPRNFLLVLRKQVFNLRTVLKILYLIWWGFFLPNFGGKITSLLKLLVNLLLCYIMTKSWIQSFCQLVFFLFVNLFCISFWNWLIVGFIDLNIFISHQFLSEQHSISG